jgi:hypothetical protein
VKLTEITLRAFDGRVLGKPEILWPPEQGIPDVMHVATKTFVRTAHPRGRPVYREALTMGITNFDFK